MCFIQTFRIHEMAGKETLNIEVGCCQMSGRADRGGHLQSGAERKDSNEALNYSAKAIEFAVIFPEVK